MRSRARIPVSRPSFVAPAVTSRMDAGAGLLIRKSSFRVSSTRTGRRSAERGAGGQRVDDQELAAEPATERGSGDPDARDRQAEQLGHLGSDIERALGGGA